MHTFILDLYEKTEKGTKVITDPSQKQEIVEKYQQICLEAEKEEPPAQKNKRGKPKQTKGKNLVDRLIKYQTGFLAFAFEQVPFSNNQAEQDIRPIKIKAKVAMSFRTLHGAQVYARIQGVIKTLRKHKMNVLQNLININLKQKIVFNT
jgi:transposase